MGVKAGGPSGDLIPPGGAVHDHPVELAPDGVGAAERGRAKGGLGELCVRQARADAPGAYVEFEYRACCETVVGAAHVSHELLSEPEFLAAFGEAVDHQDGDGHCDEFRSYRDADLADQAVPVPAVVVDVADGDAEYTG